MTIKQIAVLLGVAYCLFMRPAQATLIIDSFDMTTLTPFTLCDTYNIAAASEAVGGYRTIYQPGCTSGDQSTEINTAASPGALSSTSTGAGGVNTFVGWDADGAGLGGIDLTDGGVNDIFLLSGLTGDFFLIQLELEDTSGNSAQVSVNTSGGDLSVPFSDFLLPLNLTSIDDIGLILASEMQGAGSQPTIGISGIVATQRESVPEPSILALISLGIIGISLSRLRIKT